MAAPPPTQAGSTPGVTPDLVPQVPAPRTTAGNALRTTAATSPSEETVQSALLAVGRGTEANDAAFVRRTATEFAGREAALLAELAASCVPRGSRQPRLNFAFPPSATRGPRGAARRHSRRSSADNPTTAVERDSDGTEWSSSEDEEHQAEAGPTEAALPPATTQAPSSAPHVAELARAPDRTQAAVSDPVLHERPESVVAPVAPVDTDTALSDAALRRRLVRFYTRHDPSKIPLVDLALMIFRGREAELFGQLRGRFPESVEEDFLDGTLPRDPSPELPPTPRAASSAASATSAEFVASVRRRLVRFYTRHDPSRVAQVDLALIIFRGREQELFAQLRLRFPEAVDDDFLDEGEIRAGATELADAAARSATVPGEDARPPPQHSTRPVAAAPAETANPTSSDAAMRQRLVRFYTRHDPSKICQVDLTLQMFHGREDELFAQLRSQFPESVAGDFLQDTHPNPIPGATEALAAETEPLPSDSIPTTRSTRVSRDAIPAAPSTATSVRARASTAFTPATTVATRAEEALHLSPLVTMPPPPPREAALVVDTETNARRDARACILALAAAQASRFPESPRAAALEAVLTMYNGREGELVTAVAERVTSARAGGATTGESVATFVEELLSVPPAAGSLLASPRPPSASPFVSPRSRALAPGVSQLVKTLISELQRLRATPDAIHWWINAAEGAPALLGAGETADAGVVESDMDAILVAHAELGRGLQATGRVGSFDRSEAIDHGGDEPQPFVLLPNRAVPPAGLSPPATPRTPTTRLVVLPASQRRSPQELHRRSVSGSSSHLEDCSIDDVLLPMARPQRPSPMVMNDDYLLDNNSALALSSSGRSLSLLCPVPAPQRSRTPHNFLDVPGGASPSPLRPRISPETRSERAVGAPRSARPPNSGHASELSQQALIASRETSKTTESRRFASRDQHAPPSRMPALADPPLPAWVVVETSSPGSRDRIRCYRLIVFRRITIAAAVAASSTFAERHAARFREELRHTADLGAASRSENAVGTRFAASTQEAREQHAAIVPALAVLTRGEFAADRNGRVVPLCCIDAVLPGARSLPETPPQIRDRSEQPSSASAGPLVGSGVLWGGGFTAFAATRRSMADGGATLDDARALSLFSADWCAVIEFEASLPREQWLAVLRGAAQEARDRTWREERREANSGFDTRAGHDDGSTLEDPRTPVSSTPFEVAWSLLHKGVLSPRQPRSAAKLNNAAPTAETLRSAAPLRVPKASVPKARPEVPWKFPVSVPLFAPRQQNSTKLLVAPVLDDDSIAELL